MSATRRARVQALAKVNLDLRVLGKRADGFHELRTIFQTISLADHLEISFTAARATTIDLDDAGAIPDNLVVRAARLALDAMRVSGRVELRLVKRIAMGAGLGGGSSDAAAVLLALPTLAGRTLETSVLCALAQELGSDVPFFLLGGAAAGIGRGTELFPLPDMAAVEGVVVAPGIHVSTPEAYARLSPRLTTESQQNKINSFQSQLWWQGCPGSQVRKPGSTHGQSSAGLRGSKTAQPWAGENDFESVVFEMHPEIGALKARLAQMGAGNVLMTGSGCAVFGLFSDRRALARAVKLLEGEKAVRISLISRARYRSLWWRALHEHITGKTWPPRSRYAR